MRMPFIILILLLWFGVVLAESVNNDIRDTLSASLDRDSARVGSVVMLSLSYQLPEGAHVPEEPEIKGLEGLTIIDREVGVDLIRVKLLIDRLTPWRSGPLSLSYLDKEDKTHTMTTYPVSLNVLSNLGEKPEEARLRPIQGIIPIKAVWLQYLPWGGYLLGVLLIVLGLVWWYKRSHGKKRLIVFEEPPHIRARKQIEGLEARGLFEKGDVKGFYSLFSQILRRYLESLRGFPAAEFTTEEIERHIDNDQDRKLLSLLRHADLIKFADTIPTPAKKEEEVNEALSYIQETSPPMETGYSTDGAQGVSE